jgi:hypothetical protein
VPNHILRAAALAAALLPAIGAVADPLTLDQALNLAVQRSQMARAARAGAMSAAEMARASGQQPDPMLTLGIDNLPVTGSGRFSTNAEDMTMKRIGIAQEWVSADKRSAREAVSGAMHRRESVMEGVAAADARMQAAMAYVEAYYAGEALKLTALNEKHAREELDAGKGRLATVSGSSAEVLGLSSALGAAEDDSAETSSTGTIRWRPGNGSTGPAGRPSWTWTSSPSTRTTPRPAASRSRPASRRTSASGRPSRDRAAVSTPTEAVGTVAENERAIHVVQSRVNGFVEKLHVRANLDAVTAGQPVATLFAPDWVAAQDEYLALRRLNTDPALVDAARQRLALLSIPPEVVRARSRRARRSRASRCAHPRAASSRISRCAKARWSRPA